MANEKLLELIQTYKTISSIMEQEGLTMDNSFRRVQTWLANKLCTELTIEDIKNLS